MAPAERVRVEVVWCPRPGVAERVELDLPAGATLEQALQASGLPWQGLKVGIWSKVRELGTPLRDRDRVELYRPLTVDPKEARRQRYQRAKAKPAA